jgi:hypothetical protein
MTEESNYFWLSFVDDDKPKGSKSLGIAIVRADDMVQAVHKAWETGCNPGGEIAGMGPFKMINAPDEFKALPLHTLLSRQQLIEAGVKT